MLTEFEIRAAKPAAKPYKLFDDRGLLARPSVAREKVHFQALGSLDVACFHFAPLQLIQDGGLRRVLRISREGRPAIHDMPVHGFRPCRSSAGEAGRVDFR